MVQLAGPMKTQCIGRYLVDFPKNFKLLNPDLTLYYGRGVDFGTIDISILKYNATVGVFTESLKKRETELSGITNAETGKSNLIDSRQIKNNEFMFTTYKNSGAAIAREHELHSLVGRVHAVVRASSYEGVSDAVKDLSPAVEARMLKLASEIRPVSEPTAAGPGFCLETIVVDSDNDFENADMTFEMTRHPDVTVNIWMDNQSNAPDALHERMSAFGSMADGKHLTILRSNKLTLAGVPAQEQLAKIVEDGRTEFHFVIESRPEEPSLRQEGINMRLTTGGQLPNGRYVDSSLTEGEALALWDGIVKSFKPRPGAVRGAPADK